MSEPPPQGSLRYKALHFVALWAEKVYDAAHRFLAWVTGRLGKPMVAEIYHATPVTGGVAVKGRVLLARKRHEPRAEDPKWKNLVRMMARWATPERPHSLVRLSLEGATVEEAADSEGYFDVLIPTGEVRSGEMLVELPRSEVSEPATHSIYDVGEEPKCLIVSDIDDTVLVTHAATRLRMLATTMLGNAFTRQLFPGAPELYRALRHGADREEDRRNPLIYVTSSPYNLHDLIELVFAENGLPTGPCLMTDWGLDTDRWFKKSHSEHKSQAIADALAWYPDIPVILIGDSGQHDTPIYVRAALDHPGRVDQILIRDVSGQERLEELAIETEALEGTGARFDFFGDSAEAAEILTQRGWISREQQASVAAAVEKSEESGTSA